MRILPILFSGLVQATLDDRKTQTRRVVKPQPCPEASRFIKFGAFSGSDFAARFGSESANAICDRRPKYRPGDILWVRETWKVDASDLDNDSYVYKADGELERFPNNLLIWRPSIHMPKAAARLFLRVTDVRVERLQDMRHDEAAKEGIRAFTDPQNGIVGFCWAEGVLNIHDMPKNPTRAFEMLWNGINAKRGYGWDTNPWVWVISFERCERPAGWPGKVGAA